MALNFDADPSRGQLKFGTEGLPAREELLLKSLIRILDYRTLHQWSYDPESADLWLLAEGSRAPPASANSGKPFKVLHVSANAASSIDFLVRPLRSDQVEVELNRVGRLITAARSAAATLLAQPAASAPTLRSALALAPAANPSHLNAPAIGSAFVSGVESFQLIRWPSIHLLGNTQRIRLSTIMLGRPLTLAEITERSHLSQAYCLDFLAVLKAERLVVASLAPPFVAEKAQSQNSNAPNASTTEKLSLFARIRNRLTLKNPTLS
jgi:hypothetical protein